MTPPCRVVEETLSFGGMKIKGGTMGRIIGACLHSSRFHCWHKIDREFPKIIVYECCRCGARKRGYKQVIKSENEHSIC
ncbi:MAG: hypothetical protein ACFFG0_30630 [Candidatus Thorarchaeota archaeon]